MKQFKKSGNGAGYLDGQLIIAMPGTKDERFDKTVIYICAHTKEGAMGIVVNKPAFGTTLPELMVQLNIVSQADVIRLPKNVELVQVLKGGPVETGRGFVLHSPDYVLDETTLLINKSFCLTATVDILRSIAKGKGPDMALLALGYAGWSAGQLESEIQANGWLHCPADADLVFQTSFHLKYDQALRKIGIEPAMLSMDAGHA